MKIIYIGLDVATTTGIAIYSPGDNRAKVSEYKGDPFELFNRICSHVLIPYVYYDRRIVMEKILHFQNAATTRSLLERYGYIKYSSIAYGISVQEVNLNSVRAYLGCKNKGDVKHYFIPSYKGRKTFTDNHSDALAVAIYQSSLDGFQNDPLFLRIEDMEIK